jgi:hypothetical protein
MEVIEVTEREVEVIEVVERGPAGPTGATGPQGPAGAGGVTSVTGTAPIVSSGGTTPAISVTVGSASNTVCAGNDSRLSDARTPLSHTHGNITNAGLVGTTSGLPLKTGTGGVIEAGAFGTSAGQFAEGGHTHSAATTSVAGFLSTSDKTRLDGLAAIGSNFTTIDWNSGSYWQGSLSANTTITFQNVVSGKVIVVAITGAGGFGINWPSGITWVSGVSAQPAAGQTMYIRLVATSQTTFVGALDTKLGSSQSAADITSGTLDNARINFAAPNSIGNTTPSTGAFTTLTATPPAGSTALTLTGGTVTASVPVMSVTQTWNNAAGSFTTAEMRTSVTAGNGYLFRLFAGASGTTERFRIASDGEVNSGAVQFTIAGAGGGLSSPNFSIGNGNHWRSGSNGALVWTDTANNAFAGTNDLFLRRDAAGTLAQYNGTNAQTFRIYNTFTDVSNYERAALRWNSNILELTTEAAGTGSLRAIYIGQSDNNITTVIARRTTFDGNGTGLFCSPPANQCSIGAYLHSVRTLSNSVQIFAQNSAGSSSIAHIRCDSGLIRLFTDSSSSTAHPAFKNSGSTLQVRVANDSGFAPVECAGLTLNGNLTASTRDIVTDTTTGTKIGTGTTQKIGFFNATPVVQQAAVADATDAASTQARLNDLLARLRTLGLIAT